MCLHSQVYFEAPYALQVLISCLECVAKGLWTRDRISQAAVKGGWSLFLNRYPNNGSKRLELEYFFTELEEIRLVGGFMLSLS